MSSLDHLFKALSDRNRFRVIAALLQSKELCACQIHEWLRVTGATASKHMGILVASGLVLSRKDGRWVHYRINREQANLRPLMSWIRNQVKVDIDLLEDLKDLSSVTACPPVELRKRQRLAASTCC
jgi:ArsR family transcriptional regulator